MIIMHTEREIKIITTVFISVLLITNTVLTAVIKEPLLACLIASLALVILYISAAVMVKRIYARIAGVRTAAKELSIRKSANNESEGISAIKQEMLTEGEFGKLSGAIYDMYTGILEAADREKDWRSCWRIFVFFPRELTISPLKPPRLEKESVISEKAAWRRPASLLTATVVRTRWTPLEADCIVKVSSWERMTAFTFTWAGERRTASMPLTSRRKRLPIIPFSRR